MSGVGPEECDPNFILWYSWKLNELFGEIFEGFYKAFGDTKLYIIGV
jgi:hypothetical protein